MTNLIIGILFIIAFGAIFYLMFVVRQLQLRSVRHSDSIIGLAEASHLFHDALKTNTNRITELGEISLKGIEVCRQHSDLTDKQIKIHNELFVGIGESLEKFAELVNETND